LLTKEEKKPIGMQMKNHAAALIFFSFLLPQICGGYRYLSFKAIRAKLEKKKTFFVMNKLRLVVKLGFVLKCFLCRIGDEETYGFLMGQLKDP
jgi:hypothetical protein